MNHQMFLFLFLFFSMLLQCSFFRLKESFKVKNGLFMKLLFFLEFQNMTFDFISGKIKINR